MHHRLGTASRKATWRPVSSEPEVAPRRSQCVPGIEPREVVAWTPKTRCRATVRDRSAALRGTD
eukprot:5066195-Prymnesium_polylepis.1